MVTLYTEEYPWWRGEDTEPEANVVYIEPEGPDVAAQREVVIERLTRVRLHSSSVSFD